MLINNQNDLPANLLIKAPDAWQDYDSIICESISVQAVISLKIISIG